MRAPVVRGGELRYVVTALVKPDEIRGVLTRQRVPADWVDLDRGRQRPARGALARARGEPRRPAVRAACRRSSARAAPKASAIAYALEGERIFTPYSRLAASGWIACSASPTPPLDGAAYRSLAIYGGGVLLSLALGRLAALWVARSINRPIADLRAAAQALGRRETPQPPETSIQEIREVARGAGDRARGAGAGEAEREELLRKERHARETRGGGGPRQGRVPGRAVARAAHAAQRHLRLGAHAAGRRSSSDAAIVARALDAIVRNADAQVQLIDDLLDVSRIIDRQDAPRRAAGRPATACCRRALDAVRPAADAKAIRLQTVLDPRAGPVTGDPARLQQVVVEPADERGQVHAAGRPRPSSTCSA